MGRSSSSLYAYNCLSTFTDWTESENCLVYNPSLPLFTDPENGDYTLAKYSQAINVGNNGYVTTGTDLAGNSRIVDGVVDLGAYEYQLTVTTLEDIVDDQDGFLSLREALTIYAAEGDWITFAENLAGGTITLSGTEIAIDKGITIDASGIGGITVSGNGNSRIFNVSGGTEERPVELIGLVITDGNEKYGGGIYCTGNLSLTDCAVINNNADWGGGFYNTGNITLTNSSVSDNTSVYFGGGIYNENASLTLVKTEITGNNSNYYGGGIYSNYGELTLTLSTVSENTVVRGSGGGIYNHYGTLSSIGCEISRNRADVSGGGVDNDTGGTVIFAGCTIAGNSANQGGGVSSSGDCEFYNTIIALNTSETANNDIHTSSGSLKAYYSLSSYTDWTESDGFITYDRSRQLFADFDGKRCSY